MIVAVYRFTNGMVMVFDENGKQVPEFQGRWEEKKEAIEAATPIHNTHGPIDWFSSDLSEVLK